jgi:uncharacterized membrane protein
LLPLFTGIWLFVWIFVSFRNGLKRYKIKREFNIETSLMENIWEFLDFLLSIVFILIATLFAIGMIGVALSHAGYLS